MSGYNFIEIKKRNETKPQQLHLRTQNQGVHFHGNKDNDFFRGFWENLCTVSFLTNLNKSLQCTLLFPELITSVY